MAIGDMTLTAIGNLTTDPDLSFTSSGIAVCRFTIAVNPREFDRASGRYRDIGPSFVPCMAWRALAENITESLTRGARVIASGQWREERWEKDGQKHARWRLAVEGIGPDLGFATATVQRSARRPSTGPTDAPNGGSS